MAQNEKNSEKGGKDSKRGAKDEATILLRRLAEDVAQLRAELDDVRTASLAAVSSAPQVVPGPGKSTEVGIGLNTTSATFLRDSLTALDTSEDRALLLADWEDTRAARLGYAFSSAPKIALLRLMLTDGAQTAAQLGEKARLSTGSLYHHLRELVHAEVIATESRSRYALTPYGRRAVLLLFTLAAGSKE